MSAPVWCEFTCDDCSTPSPGMWASGDFVPREALQAKAAQEGFTFTGSTCLCRSCVRKQDAMQTAPTKEQQP